MLASLAGALTALAITLAPNPFALSEIVMWLNGALTDRSWREVWIAAPLTIAGIGVLALAAKSLDALTLGEAAARSLGVEPRRLLALLVVGIGLTVGAGVAVAGIIGFVGLVVPHLVRPLTDRLPSSLILPSALAGACLVLAADSIVRVLPLVTELRLGIALSLIGAPFFGWLLNLTLTRGGRRVVEGLTAALAPGRITAIVGPNGAGKSSLLLALAGLLEPDAGAVTLDGSPLGALAPRARAQAIGYLPQSPDIAWDVSTESLVALGRLPWRDRGT
eukprot:gene25579-46655_t